MAKAGDDDGTVTHAERLAAARKRMVPMGQAHIQSTFNKTIVTVTIVGQRADVVEHRVRRGSRPEETRRGAQLAAM